MRKRIQKKKPLHKFTDRGFRGYPIATVAYYGPDNKRATKVAVGIVPNEHEQPSEFKRWFSEMIDVRVDAEINSQIISFIKFHGAKSVVVAYKIMGCPHEEGKDYPEGSVCPKCPFWRNRDRFTGEIIH